MAPMCERRQVQRSASKNKHARLPQQLLTVSHLPALLLLQLLLFFSTFCLIVGF